jgi:ABC-type polysaccharide/polyol phosphate transport system ATPase subunit
MSAMILEGVHVEFPIYAAQRSLRKALFARAAGGLIERDNASHSRVVVRALNDFSLELNEGDRLGLVGHNGAGKSTVLKVMAGVYEPVIGRVLATGKITPCFDILPGLDLEDTGYENIITGGLLLGMSRTDIETKISDIEQFSELGEYLSLPLRTYSAGMLVRLGFSVATAMDPGILLIDEGIGAVDARFAERASERLREFIDRSSVLVVASHSDELIRSWCNMAALLDGGRLVQMGPVEEILEAYHAKGRAKANNIRAT